MTSSLLLQKVLNAADVLKSLSTSSFQSFSPVTERKSQRRDSVAIITHMKLEQPTMKSRLYSLLWYPGDLEWVSSMCYWCPERP